MRDGFRMRAKRYGRCGTWLVLGFLLLLTAPTPTPRPPFLTPTATDTSIPAIGRSWPVGARPTVLRGWEPPATVYGRGHRGVDLSAPAGSPVRAVAAGRVSFAGRVAGRGVVSVQLTDTDLRTTYEPVKASVQKGDEVTPGDVVGTLEPTGGHCTVTCIHW